MNNLIEGKKKSKHSTESENNVPTPPKPEIKEDYKKSQKVKVLVSVFRYGDKIISALGIPSPIAIVDHRLQKNKLKPDEMFNIISALANDPFYKNDQRWVATVKYAIDQNYSEIIFPGQAAGEFSKKSIGNLIHEILSVEIELFIK